MPMISSLMLSDAITVVKNTAKKTKTVQAGLAPARRFCDAAGTEVSSFFNQVSRTASEHRWKR